jgi:hypothetical protein
MVAHEGAKASPGISILASRVGVVYSNRMGRNQSVSQRIAGSRIAVSPDKPSSLKIVLHPAPLRAVSCMPGDWS